MADARALDDDLVRAVELLFERGQRTSEVEAKLGDARRADALGQRFDCIRDLYEIHRDSIMRGEYDPYIIDWMPEFTPIEDMAWHSIRCLGLPMYPQYPAGRFFVDFGDPVKKIAVECDGKKWHDKERDRQRDLELAEIGWRTFRISGVECNSFEFDWREAREQGKSDDEVERLCRHWIRRTGEGVISCIAVAYYGGKLPHRCLDMGDVCESLHQHRLLPFDL